VVLAAWSVILPRCGGGGIAWRALTTRFWKTCRICERSTCTGEIAFLHFDGDLGGRARGGHAHGIIEDFRRRHHAVRAGVPLGEGEKLLGQRLGGEAGRLAVLEAGVIVVVLRQRYTAENVVRRLLKSWAMPPASRPSDSKRLAFTSSSGVRFISSGLRKTITTPSGWPLALKTARAVQTMGTGASPSRAGARACWLRSASGRRREGHCAGVVFRRLAALAVTRPKHVAGGFSEQFLGAALQQARGDGIQEHRLPLGVGHQHGFRHGGKRPVQHGGRKRRSAGRIRGDGIRHCAAKPDHAQQLVLRVYCR